VSLAALRLGPADDLALLVDRISHALRAAERSELRDAAVLPLDGPRAALIPHRRRMARVSDRGHSHDQLVLVQRDRTSRDARLRKHLHCPVRAPVRPAALAVVPVSGADASRRAAETVQIATARFPMQAIVFD
jgi:hypothetical protein